MQPVSVMLTGIVCEMKIFQRERKEGGRKKRKRDEYDDREQTHPLLSLFLDNFFRELLLPLTQLYAIFLEEKKKW